MVCLEKSIFFQTWNSNDNSCIVDYCLSFMDSVRKQSCGKDVLCREGTWQVYQIIKDISNGNSRSEDFELLKEILMQCKEYASCEMVQDACSKCLLYLTEYEEEWDAHIRRNRCKNLICRGSYTVYIDPLICDGCSLCIGICPEGAIRGETNMIHVIDSHRCKKELLCIDICPRGAIKKYGSIKPKLPTDPIPVGSFADASASREGMRRRRRRKE